MKILDLRQGTPEWHEWRFTGVGASDLASILDISPHKDATRDDLLREKVFRTQKAVNYAMRKGHRLEPVARRAYLLRHPCEVQVCCIQHDLYSWALTSSDGLCTGEDSGQRWLMELKYNKADRHQEALAECVPYYHAPQVQWQLFCSGLDRCDYVSWNDGKAFEGRELAIVTVARDEELIGRLVNAAAEFWMEVIDQREANGLL